MSSWRRVLPAAGLAGMVIGFGLVGPKNASAGSTPDTMYADLDGKPIALVEVGDHYCHDFDFPAIHCFSDPKELDSTQARAAAAAVSYATIYDFTGFQGSFMHLSENYTVLAWIGWNDRISSFVVKNSQSGNFYTDWYYGGTVYGFCCNQQLPGLGSFNNTFSSVYRF